MAGATPRSAAQGPLWQVQWVAFNATLGGQPAMYALSISLAQPLGSQVRLLLRTACTGHSHTSSCNHCQGDHAAGQLQAPVASLVSCLFGVSHQAQVAQPEPLNALSLLGCTVCKPP